MARSHMEEQGFTYTSVACYMRTWRSVYKFGISKGITHYSAALAEQYMLEKYRMSIGENSVDGSRLSPYMAQKVRALQALTDFKLHGFVPKLTHGEVVYWPTTSTGTALDNMNRLFRSTAPRFPRPLPKANFLVMKRERLPTHPPAANSAISKWPPTAHCFWMKLENCRCRCRRSCCAFWRTG